MSPVREKAMQRMTTRPPQLARPARKRSPRPNKSGKKSASRSEAHKLEARARTAEDRRRNPAKYSRLGVPDGMRKAEADKLWALAKAQADKAALHGAVVIALGPTNNRTKGMAINAVLRFTKAPPAQRVAVAPSIDHAWLTEALEAHRATSFASATQPEQLAT